MQTDLQLREIVGNEQKLKYQKPERDVEHSKRNFTCSKVSQFPFLDFLLFKVCSPEFSEIQSLDPPMTTQGSAIRSFNPTKLSLEKVHNLIVITNKY